MVIFILLLLVFMNRSAAKNKAITDTLIERLRADLNIQPGFSRIRIDRGGSKNDPNAILIVVPDRLMNFETGKHDLRAEGGEFLSSYIPRLAQNLCSSEFRNNIESVTVEGYTDQYGYRGMTREQSQNENLRLSQERSMEVVARSLDYLIKAPAERDCFLDKLSATGRGEQDQQTSPEESRRVIFRIRVNADRIQSLKAKVK
jgi:outer membrane protein OmpA-like peptidoglycan-associated protein